MGLPGGIVFWLHRGLSLATSHMPNENICNFKLESIVLTHAFYTLFYSAETFLFVLETIRVIIRLNGCYCFPIVDPIEKVPAGKTSQHEKVAVSE